MGYRPKRQRQSRPRQTKATGLSLLKMKILTKDGVLSRDGYVAQYGVTVALDGDVLTIGATQHNAADFEITADRVTSKPTDCSVVL